MRSLGWLSLVAAVSLVMVLAGCGAADQTKWASPASAPTSSISEFATPEPLPASMSLADNPEPNTEEYAAIPENDFRLVSAEPLSTFSIDVDTASYSNVRRMLVQQGMLPPPGAVRIEEFVNYFPYHDAPPANDEPFAVHAEVASCPWQPEHRLVRFGLKGKEIDDSQRPVSNLVFLIDVSGSMSDDNKLPLIRSALRMLVQRLGENDRVALVVYAGSSGLVLPSTPAHRKGDILAGLNSLEAGGSTNGGEGLQLAYRVARENFLPQGTNRVILCTDGDFNVGITDKSSLVKFVSEQARSGVALTVLGCGQGNFKDGTVEQLADKGNGNYGYIDNLQEARKLLVEQMTGTLITIAKDVKIQVEFNPRLVSAYRLIGYENRLLNHQDFKDDQKDAGEIGAGHTVTALYEIIPVGVETTQVASVDGLRYQGPPALSTAADSNEMLTLKLRYKQPDSDTSSEIRFALLDAGKEFGEASEDFRFASAVAEFGMLLTKSKYRGNLTWSAVAEIAQSSKGDDPQGYRNEFVSLVQTAAKLQPQ